MLFERPSEVSSFNRYMLPGIADETYQRSMLFRYPQQCVTGPVGQESPFINGNHGVLKLGVFLRSEQKRFHCLYLPVWDFALERLDRVLRDFLARHQRHSRRLGPARLGGVDEGYWRW